jgi:hypothetical protein
MSTAIKLKKSSVAGKVPTVGDLNYGELAINYADGKIYYKNSSNQIKAFIDSAAVATIAATGGGGGGDTYADSDARNALLAGSHISINYTNGEISVQEATIDHDNLTNFISNEHVDHTAVSVVAGSGLTGGGTIASSRTLNVGAGTGITVNADDIEVDMSAFSTTNLSEGSNLYYTSARVDSDIDGRVTQTYVNNLNVDADTVDGIQGASLLRSDTPDVGVTLELQGGSTYDPAGGGVGTDTTTTAGLALPSGTRIVGTYDGYIRTLLDWSASSDIEIGQGSTSLIAGINLLPGSGGNAKVNGNRILTTADEGSGNGIDADTLDGQEGSYYLDYNNFTNTPTIPTSGVDFDPVGTDNSTNVTLAGSYNYLTLSGQQITLAQIDASTDISGLATVATTGAYSDLSGTPSIPTLGTDFVDSAQVSNIITADVDATFINALTIDADTLGGQSGSYYLNYNNFSNTPSIPTLGNDYVDSAQVSNIITADVDASFINALTIDADTLGNQSGSYYLNYNNFTNTPSIPTLGTDFVDSAQVSLIITADVDAAFINALTIDADTLGSVSASSFLRSDAADTKTSGDLGFSDNVKATFGTGADLQIYHNGSGANIENSTGTLHLRSTSGGQVKLQAVTGEQGVIVYANGAVELYYDNAKKLETTSTGVDITGGLETTGDVIVGGNLQVTGTTTTINTEDLTVTDNMIYMNAGESSGSPTLSIDVGWAGNVNDDGSYAHVGMFRDATDNTFKVFEGYTPEPDAAVEINTGHASFSLAPFAARTIEADSATINTSLLVNGADNNGGKADFAVATGGIPQISFRNDQVQIGNNDMNWVGRVYYSGGLQLGAWNANVNIFNEGDTTSRDITFQPSYQGTRTERMIIKGETGRVGIGISSPVHELDVNGQAWFRGNVPGLDDVLYLGAFGDNANSPMAQVSIDDSNGDILATRINRWGGDHRFQRNSQAGNGINMMRVDGNSTTNLRLYDQASPSSSTSVTEAVRISTNGSSYFNGGNVGIGTSSPSSELTVSGDVEATGAFNFTSTTGNVIEYGGSAIMERLTTNGGTIIGKDDILILGAGEAAGQMRSNTTHSNETVYIGGESGIVFITSPDNWATSWAGRNEMVYNTSGDLSVPGALSATTKSFDIEHPTKEGMRLRYGSLEGPENGVYVRGRLKDNNTIELPDYWTGLIHEDTITVNLTAIGRSQDIWVEDIADNKVIVGGENINCFYTVYAERKDVERFKVEYKDES